MGDKEYKDKLEITPQEIYRWSDENRTTPKTAAPSIEDAMNIIEKYQLGTCVEERLIVDVVGEKIMYQ